MQSAERSVTYWLKLAALVALAWYILEKAAEYFSHVGYAATIAIGGMLVAYLFYPIVRWLNTRLPRWASILTVYVGFGAFAILALSYIVPILATQLEEFVEQLPRLESAVANELSKPNAPVLSHLPPGARHYVVGLPGQFTNYLRNDAAAYIGNLLAMLLSVFMLGAIFILVPVVSIYMLNESEGVKRLLLGMIPARHRERTNNILAELDEVAGGFVRGQLLVALAVGVMVTSLLLALHVPYALLIGVCAGVLEIVPYLGAVIGAILGVLMAGLSHGLLGAALASLGFAAIHQLDGAVLSPYICGRTVRITPLAATFSVLIGAQLFGLVGVLIAVPAAGALRVLIENVRPPEELTNAEVKPGLTKAPRDVVHPLAASSAVTKDEVEAAIAEMKP